MNNSSPQNIGTIRWFIEGKKNSGRAHITSAIFRSKSELVFEFPEENDFWLTELHGTPSGLFRGKATYTNKKTTRITATADVSCRVYRDHGRVALIGEWIENDDFVMIAEFVLPGR